MDRSDSEFADPNSAISVYGADALRLCLLGMEPWESMKYHPELVKKAHGTLNILWNSYVFAATYMSMDNWDPKEQKYSKIRKDFRPEDQWLISRLESLTQTMKREMDSYNIHKACQALESFIVDDLSRWYIRIVRDRVWTEGKSTDKDAVFMALTETLNRLAIISSPIIPFISETIYQEFDGSELTVSMATWPEHDATRLAEGMERNMANARMVVDTANKLRQEHGIQTRWPVRSMTIAASSEELSDSVKMFKDIIKSQANVKKLELVPENQEWAGQELIVVPNPNIIGKAYKQWESKIARMLKVLPAKDIKEKIDAGEYSLGIEGQVVRILPEMVHFETKLPEGVVSKEFPNGIMYFETMIDDELTAEGFARQVMRRIQEMRKEMGLDPEEFIRLSIVMSDGLLETLDNWLEKIADSTRANQLEIVEEASGDDYVVEWPIEFETVVIGITSLNIKKSMDEFISIKEVDHELALSIVEAGIEDSRMFLETDRELLLKIPGMSHSKLRKIKEYLETPEDMRKGDDQICPLCNGIVEPGRTNCQRCGKDLVGGDDLDVEFIGAFYEEEEGEEEYEEEYAVKEKVMIRKKPKEEEKPPQPEDEIIKMATVTEKVEPTPEDLITSEIMSSLGDDDILPPPREKEAIVKEEKAEPAIAEEPVPPIPVPVMTQVEPSISTEPEQEQKTPITEPDQKEHIPEPYVEEHFPETFKEEHPEPSEPTQEEPSTPEEPSTEKSQPLSEMDNGKNNIIDSNLDNSVKAMADAFDIKNSVAKALLLNGFDSMEALENASEEELREIKGVGKVTARRIKQKLSKDDTKMCSLCNAIVSANSDICERCGVMFSGGAKKDEIIEEEGEPTPSDASLLYSKAIALKDAGNTEEALRTLDRAIELEPENEKYVSAKNELETPAQEEIETEELPAPIPEPVVYEEEIESEVLPEYKEEHQEEDTPPTEAPIAPIDILPVPVEPEPEPEEEEIKLKSSFTYLIPEDRSTRSYKLFKDSIDKGMAGYCVTRTFPEKIRDRYNLGETPILWLSNVAKEDAVRPKDLEKLSLSLEEFLSGQGGIVLLDGIEYLITNNNFITVLKLIQSLRDQVAINRSILLLSINPSTMDDHQINLLRREVDTVIEY